MRLLGIEGKSRCIYIRNLALRKLPAECSYCNYNHAWCATLCFLGKSTYKIFFIHVDFTSRPVLGVLVLKEYTASIASIKSNPLCIRGLG